MKLTRPGPDPYSTELTAAPEGPQKILLAVRLGNSKLESRVVEESLALLDGEQSLEKDTASYRTQSIDYQQRLAERTFSSCSGWCSSPSTGDQRTGAQRPGRDAHLESECGATGLGLCRRRAGVRATSYCPNPLGLTLWVLRNLPGLYEVAVFPRIQLDPGIRYAVLTISRYGVFLIGMLIALAAIQLNLTQIGWLMAAIGFGLGFGMQEIFSNFVSGLILRRTSRSRFPARKPLRANDIREMELKSLLAGLKAGSVDVGVAALTVTEEREEAFDFSHPADQSDPAANDERSVMGPDPPELLGGLND